MATNYGYQKGKHGIFAGTIIAFSAKLDGSDPNDDTWRTRVPAGYLRCDGSIKEGDAYPALKKILGVGASSKYRKDGVVLEEEDEDGLGGQFQLPDLGSKYVRATPTSGGYNYLTSTNPLTDSEVLRVGVAATVSTNITNPITIFYTGAMSIPSVAIPISATLNFGSTLGATTPEGYPDYTSFLPHGHYCNLVQRDDNVMNANCSTQDASAELTKTDVDVIDDYTSVAGTTTGVTHTHGMTRSPVTRSTTQVNVATTITPDNITTTVNLNTTNISKMDDIQHAFILVEYLIKI
jgi:hypothetical protein